MKNLISLLVTLIVTIQISNAQVSQGGEPTNWKSANLDIEAIRLPELNMSEIEAEDAERDQYKEFGFRFGIEHPVDLNTENSGVWTIENGKMVWRLAVHAPDAKSMSFVFNEFDLPKGAELFIYDKEQTHFIGAFNYKNKQANGMLSTSLVYGEDVIVELSAPETTGLSELRLSINQIVHGYRGITSKFAEVKFGRGPFGNSGSCNINVNCPQGDDWQVEKQSVALIVSGGLASCSGALINNTANDGHPYFLTADHCLGGGVGNWVFYFNHETAGCTGNNGPTNQSVSGASIVANNGGSDFALLEINNGNTIPSNYDPEWAGWDNSDNESAVTSATCIHHPGGDLKKISHENDAPYHATTQGAQVWYIDEWEEGTTEGGSSGSPLFNQDHKIIGQLYGGFASCTNQNEADWYGRLGVSWDGNSSSSRLRDWLDPNNSGVTTLDGYPTGAVTYNLDAAGSGFEDVPEILCESEFVEPVFILKNNGTTTLTSATITYSYNGGGNQTINWTGSLAQNQTDQVDLAGFSAQVGNNTIEVSVSNPNGQTDENNNNNSQTTNFELSVGEEVLTLTLETDQYGYETYWEVRGPNNQLVASGGNTNVGPNGGGNETAQAGDPGAYPSNSTITETIQLAGDGCYTFLIVDDYADGICCGWTGNGEYTLRDGNNTIMAQGGEFGEDEESEFGMVGGLSVSEIDLGNLSIYPNPSNGTIFVDVEKVDLVESIEVTDVVGRSVLYINPNGVNRNQLELTPLMDGIYNVNLISQLGVVSKKIVLLKD